MPSDHPHAHTTRMMRFSLGASVSDTNAGTVNQAFAHHTSGARMGISPESGNHRLEVRFGPVHKQVAAPVERPVVEGAQGWAVGSLVQAVVRVPSAVDCLQSRQVVVKANVVAADGTAMLVRMGRVVVGRSRTRLRLPSSRKVTARLRWWAFSVPGAAARRAAGSRPWRQTEMKASNVRRDAVSAAACAHHRTRGWPRPCATVFTKHGNGRQSPGWFQGQTYRPGGRGGASGPQHMVGPLRPDPAGNRLPAPHRIEGDDASRKTQHAQQGRDGRDCVGLAGHHSPSRRQAHTGCMGASG